MVTLLCLVFHQLKGVPQIEVTFDIDTDGIIKVSARDKATNKDASITVAGSSGLSDAEIEKWLTMLKNSLNQTKPEEAIESANRADQLCNDTENSLNEHKEKLSSESVQKSRSNPTIERNCLEGTSW